VTHQADVGRAAAASASPSPYGPRTSGTAWCDCRAAARAIALSRSRRPAARAPSRRTTLRALSISTIASAPHSASFSTHQSIRSPLISDCRIEMRGARGVASRVPPYSSSVARSPPTATTRASASRPAESATTSVAPTASLRTRNR
jgi:hypothetical protein